MRFCMILIGFDVKFKVLLLGFIAYEIWSCTRLLLAYKINLGFISLIEGYHLSIRLSVYPYLGSAPLS